MNDLDPVTLSGCLPGWIADLRVFPATDSTNRQGLEWAARGAAHGSLLVADYQTEGRGRLERRWEAPAGSSLLASIVLRPDWPPEQWALLNLAAAVALCECLDDLEVRAEVKWPNDVLLGGRKVCGILAESSDAAAVLGIGVNVRQRSFPDGLRHPATSLELATGRSFDRGELACRLLGVLGPLVNGPAQRIPDLYRPWCQTLGRRVQVELEGTTVEGEAVDIDGSGALVLRGGRVVTAGDIRELR
ncbi:MAG TPA: biotin--[acetyl-CoA-carboxylase] ligase [Actinomycetota bacterium]|nr:biotin--[acetyl-CoA-carboxylase] ligase [Actinomycetota bacterium]